MLKREGMAVPLIVLASILLLALGAGTLWDLQIANALYVGKSTPFGDFFAAFGELPAYFLLHSAGIILWVHRGKRTKFQSIFLLLGSLALILLGIFGEFCEYRESMPQTRLADAVIVTVILFAANTAQTLFLLRSVSKDDAVRFVMMVLCVVAVSMLAANLVKIPWARPRIQFLREEPSAAFVPWYRPGDPQKAEFMARGVKADAFRSFPSGHVTTAAASLLYFLLITFHRFFDGKGRLILALSVLWTALVAVSRMTLGAHFLTDVVTSWLFVLILFLLFLPLVYRDSPVYKLLLRLLS